MYGQCYLLAVVFNKPLPVRLSTLQIMNRRMAVIACGELVAICKEAVVAYWNA
jgi:hypothetical protein